MGFIDFPAHKENKGGCWCFAEKPFALLQLPFVLVRE